MIGLDNLNNLPSEKEMGITINEVPLNEVILEGTRYRLGGIQDLILAMESRPLNYGSQVRLVRTYLTLVTSAPVEPVRPPSVTTPV